MSHHDPAEVQRQIEAELQKWADENVVGKAALNEDSLAEFKLAAEMLVNELLTEVGLEGWEGEVVNARLDVENDAIVTGGIRIKPKGGSGG